MTIKTESVGKRLARLSPAQRAQFARRARGSSKVTTLEIPRRTNRAIHQLAIEQELVWFIHTVGEESFFLNLNYPYGISGALDVAALYRTLSTIVGRHESLRTIFPVQSSGLPVAVVRPAVRIIVPLIDLTALPERQCVSQRERLMQRHVARRCPIETEPGFRGIVLRCASEEHVLHLVTHHIVADRVCHDILTRELATIYGAYAAGASSPLPALPVQYGDFAEWQRDRMTQPVGQAALAYWVDALTESPELNLRTDFVRPPAKRYRASRLRWRVPDELWNGFTELAAKHRLTRFGVYLAAYVVLLHRYTDQTDLVVGCHVSNRDRAEIQDVFGYFLNTLAFRVKFNRSLSFEQLVGDVRDVVTNGLIHQDVPYGLVLQRLQVGRESNRFPLVQVTYGYSNVNMEKAAEQLAVRVAPLETFHDSNWVDLQLTVHDLGDVGWLLFDFDTDLFAPETAERMFANLQTLLRAAWAAPETAVERLPVLSEAERTAVVTEWNATARVGDPRPLAARMAAVVAAHPDAVAVVGADGTHASYAAVWAGAGAVAAQLRAAGVGAEHAVGVLGERSPALVVTLLGVVRANAVCVPLDPTYPTARLAYMARDAQMRGVLASPAHTAAAAALGVPVWPWAAPASARAAVDPPAPPTYPDQLLYIIYTSGSTGQPKGVALPQRGLSNFIDAVDRVFMASPGRRILQFASIAFDASLSEWLVAFCRGATLVLPHRDERLSSTAFVAMIAREQITTVTLPPSLLAAFADVQVPTVETLVVAGEAASLSAVAPYVGRCRVINGYGPTETTIAASYSAPLMPDRMPPIGRPLMNTEMYVLDAELEPVPVGVVGEIYVGGAGVSRGYLAHGALTAARFVPDPFSDRPGTRIYKTGDRARYGDDGTIEFVGRADRQIKIRGQRIEPSEIEAAITEVSGVQHAAVDVRTDGQGAPRLVAYLVPTHPDPSLQAAVTRTLRTVLPAHMVPTMWVEMTALPVTPSGKIDRAALPAPLPPPRSVDRRPLSPLEEAVAAIWADVLGVPHIDAESSFFDAGGHSLLANRVTAQIAEFLRVDVPLRSLFEARTLAEFCREIAAAESRPGLADEAAAILLAILHAGRQTDPAAQAV